MLDRKGHGNSIWTTLTGRSSHVEMFNLRLEASEKVFPDLIASSASDLSVDVKSSGVDSLTEPFAFVYDVSAKFLKYDRNQANEAGLHLSSSNVILSLFSFSLLKASSTSATLMGASHSSLLALQIGCLQMSSDKLSDNCDGVIILDILLFQCHY